MTLILRFDFEDIEERLKFENTLTENMKNYIVKSNMKSIEIVPKNVKVMNI